ncbi:glutathione peroxidase [bacterium]|nr:glutathione peroxidase [bacterium]|tara:strand:+ start:9235 stop:9813 length:579 start_codon:yes stop_codon:yes gene_type:complete
MRTVLVGLCLGLGLGLWLFRDRLYANTPEIPVVASGLYSIEIKTLSGTEWDWKSVQGKSILFVNVASKCGFTYQYEGLQTLYEQYKDRGLVVVGVPSNSFANQEPGTATDIASFCSLNYGVSFPMMEKVPVRGRWIHPLYRYLTESNPKKTGKVSWNFNKILVDRNGYVVARFGSREKPLSKAVIQAVETTL